MGMILAAISDDNGFRVRLPGGFAAEVISRSILGGDHLGGLNAGYDITDSDGRNVEVKSAALKPARKPEFLEVKTGEAFPGGADSIVFVTTSGATTETYGRVDVEGSDVVITTTSRVRRKNGSVEAFRLDGDDFHKLQLVRVVTPVNGPKSATWRVPIGACRRMNLAAQT